MQRLIAHFFLLVLCNFTLLNSSILLTSGFSDEQRKRECEFLLQAHAAKGFRIFFDGFPFIITLSAVFWGASCLAGHEGNVLINKLLIAGGLGALALKYRWRTETFKRYDMLNQRLVQLKQFREEAQKAQREKP